MVRRAILGMILLAAARPAQAPVQSIVDAELAFARFTGEHGIKEGFLAFLAPASIVFRPGPVSGRDVYAKAAVSPTLLVWYPVEADIAASGELGYTTGPWELFKSKDEKTAIASGHYVTLWKKQADGSWKAALDAGVQHAAHVSRPPVYKSGVVAAPAAGERGSSAAREEPVLAGLEKSLNENYIQRIGSLLALGARAYRDGEFPAAGQADARALIAKYTGEWTWSPAPISVAASGDFAFVYGTAERKTGNASDQRPAPHAFLRIWKKAPSGTWTVLLDLATSMQK